MLGISSGGTSGKSGASACADAPEMLENVSAASSSAHFKGLPPDEINWNTPMQRFDPKPMAISRLFLSVLPLLGR